MAEGKEEANEDPQEGTKEEDTVEEDVQDIEKETKVPEKKPELATWKPKTEIGKKVKEGKITSIDEILDRGMKILEPEIIDFLLPDLQSELLLIGQSKGKFGGGQRRVFKQTQKKTCEGNRPKFATLAVVGNLNGYVGLSYGKSRETVPAREKALRKAKLNIIKIKRGCGSWQCSCGEPHTIPFKIKGKSGSVTLTLMPAPRGTGLCTHREIQKILKLAGITDIWSKSEGHKKTTSNLIRACEIALRKLMKIKHAPHTSIVEGAYKKGIHEDFRELESLKEEKEKKEES